MTLNAVTDGFIDALAQRLGAGAVRETTDSYLTEPRGRFQGSGRVIAPASVVETLTYS